MEKSGLRGRILTEVEMLIAQSCNPEKLNKRFRKMHQLILKKHYNAADVDIDYHRKRVKMDIVLDDSQYQPNTVNTNMATFPANFFFNNLCDFLRSSLSDDNKSLAFYAGLLRTFAKKDVELMSV